MSQKLIVKDEKTPVYLAEYAMINIYNCDLRDEFLLIARQIFFINFKITYII
jgi:hypothetical protein